MKKLLMATDLSARSDRALQRAAALAHQLGAELEVVHIVSKTVPPAIIDQYKDAAFETIKQLLAAIPAAASVKLEVEIVPGHGFAEILDRAAESKAEMIVLGITRHTENELFRGTTAERIIRVGDLPVLLVRDPVAQNYERVLVATDNSPSARSALEYAVAIAPGAQFHLLHTINVPFKGLLGSDAQKEMRQLQEDRFRKALEDEISAHAETLGASALNFTIHLEEGEITTVVRKQIAALKPGLLALGMHGKPTLRHALIGSIAADMLSNPPVDVLVARAW